MRSVCILVLSALLVSPAYAEAQKKAAKQAARPNPVVESYAALPSSERIAIQSDLVWTGDYNGIANGEFGERAIAAVKAFQKRLGGKETGVLNPQERAALIAAAKGKHEAAGWRMVDDPAGPMRIGIPTKLAPQSSPGKSGTRWFSARGETQIETFRVTDVTALATVFERQKKEPADRKITYSVLRPDFFVVGGLQGLKKFYVRAQIREREVRGFTIMYDQAVEGTVDPIVVAMSSTFLPFPGDGTASAPQRKVEYGTGVVVSRDGHVITDRQIVEGCHVITLPGLGGADRVADDATAELALLRVYGAGALRPLPLAHEMPGAGEVTVAGVADPQLQGGGGAVSALRARIAPSVSGMVLDPTPALGFSGAAALDGQGRLVGVARLSRTVTASRGAPPASAAALVPLPILRQFLSMNGVAPSATATSPADARNALVRVICVRK